MTAGMYEIHPALKPAVLDAEQRAIRMGKGIEVANGKVLSAAKDGITLSVWVVRDNKAWIIENARYQLSDPTPGIKGLLEIFAETIEGLPLQEAADHGTIHTCDRLRQNITGPLVKGVHTPASMGIAFRRCDYLIRDIAAQFRATIGDGSTRNFWNPRLSRGWHLASIKQQRAILQLAIGKFCAEDGLKPGSIRVVRLEKTRRFVVDFDEDFDAAEKPSALRRLERLVRTTTGERLEIYMEELMDNNRIRRLGSAPVEDVA